MMVGVPIRQAETQRPPQLQHKALGQTLWMPANATWRSEEFPGVFITSSYHIELSHSKR
ncbi:uncharacterized protein SETTUDRAFT_170584 [Exserohilum turcica Et28A]|uniref:Uncharacterized protein n=1 Tax=Exserohilum turcicum (strain 28A) TaxID=671987 RepID=R0J4B6_EXST2|nr:uncharacterized protein SETTUDRAFT_170584 [Exserohilum turcica Et28A]EOA91785.1 hypothetical protein SETTUDRAFT_170584 [Exserohilum turcica Et28A]